MVDRYTQLQGELRTHPRTWLVTGAAGFIGSHLTQTLLQLDQHVIGLDSFITGSRANLAAVQQQVAAAQWQKFRFIEGDIRDPVTCRQAVAGADYVLHQAALGSVPRSIADPLATHEANVTGFLNMLIAARDEAVARFVYASSSSVYGDSEALPKVEDVIGAPLSPYAATKRFDEVYAAVFARTYSIQTVGLRYFNVFGPRQDPDGPYAAVIPQWFDAILQDKTIYINGDGETSRDFCYIDNVVQANLLAATTASEGNQVYNVACGQQTTLNELCRLIADSAGGRKASIEYRAFREGDMRHSLADTSKARDRLGFEVLKDVSAGLRETALWYTSRSIDTKDINDPND